MGQAFVRGADFEVWEYEHSQDQWCPFRAEDQQRLLKQFAQYNAGSKDAAKFCLKLGEFESFSCPVVRVVSFFVPRARQFNHQTGHLFPPQISLLASEV